MAQPILKLKSYETAPSYNLTEDRQGGGVDSKALYHKLNGLIWFYAWTHLVIAKDLPVITISYEWKKLNKALLCF